MKITYFSSLTIAISIFSLIPLVTSVPDPNFFVFLAFGQSNMQGQGEIEAQDYICDERFKMMAAIDMPKTGRYQYNWYTATPPICRDDNKLSPCDYFGRRLVDKLPKRIKIGIINVSFSGAKIELFDEELKDDYLKTVTEEWFTWGIEAAYKSNPFRALVNAAREAQYDGVIKGILVHQGESNEGETDWPQKLNKIYQNLLKELNLKEEDVPLLVGEVVTTEMGGESGSHNKIIATVPQYIKNAHVISAAGLQPIYDHVHFTANGYRVFGKRYAEKMLEILNIPEEPEPEEETEEPEEKLEEKGGNNNGLVVVIIILIIIIICGGGFLFYRRSKAKSQIDLNTPLSSIEK